MRKTGWIFLLLLFCAWKKPGTGGTIKAHIYGLHNAAGFVRVSLYNKAEGFLQTGIAYRHLVAGISGKEAVAVFKDLPAGDYALAVLHDENANGKMDFNWIGMPAEGYGFSRVQAPVVAKPSFQQCSFRLEAGAEIRSLVLVGY